MPYRREASRHQQLIPLLGRQAEFARTMQNILGRAWAGNQPFLPAEDGLALYAHRARQLGVGDAGACGVRGQQFGKSAHVTRKYTGMVHN